MGGEATVPIHTYMALPHSMELWARIEGNATLTVELEETSRADAPATAITHKTKKANMIPIFFVLRHSIYRSVEGHTYSLSASIKNEKHELLYATQTRVILKPEIFDEKNNRIVIVVLIKKTTPASGKREWPELLGRKGEEAVEIIKKESDSRSLVVSVANFFFDSK
ncbi:unnamed protein product [Rotaria socialis]|uniref:Uncharacterized protein n=1 Tax=Rotaria socialis TaxID=392032 RepID=A0A818LYV5_9BILA|nr:unnamed protein product [Rotaria socialis]CAF4546459.1 unnamed protein product [Rotaria socialis]